MTEWDEFRTYDYSRIYAACAKPAFIFDGRNILDHQVMSFPVSHLMAHYSNKAFDWLFM
jgi:hypothetical protein